MQPLAITDLCPTQADAAAMSNLHSCVDRHGIFRRLRKAVVGQVSLKCVHASGMSVNPRLFSVTLMHVPTHAKPMAVWCVVLLIPFVQISSPCSDSRSPLS